MKIKYSLYILTAFFPLFILGQDYTSISGQIVDVETKDPLSFATVNIKNSPKGVVANAQGEFEFTFPNKHLADTVVFSIAGYQSEKVLAQKLVADKNLKIELVAKAVVLSEVVVTNKELTAWEILELSLKKIPENYPTDPFEFKAFYRDYKLENDKCVSIFEAAYSAYDKGYSKVGNKHALKEKVVLDQVRKSLSVDYKAHTFKRMNVLKELIKLNDVRYQTRLLNKKNRLKYTYSMAGYEVINDRLMYKIKVKEDWSYFIYVDVVTYAIPKIEMDFQWIKDVDVNEWVLGDTIKYNQTAATMLLEFQMIDGLYYPKYCSFTTNLEAMDATSNEMLFTAYLLQEYMVTDIDFDPEVKPEKSSRMDPYEMIEKQTFSYDPEFWKNYNTIKLHPRDEKLIRGLEKEMKLDDQFSKVN
ncbi:carboxypeptidase-like regulatory domain-containing protein [Ekhidna sp.]